MLSLMNAAMAAAPFDGIRTDALSPAEVLGVAVGVITILGAIGTSLWALIKLAFNTGKLAKAFELLNHTMEKLDRRIETHEGRDTERFEVVDKTLNKHGNRLTALEQHARDSGGHVAAAAPATDSGPV